MVPFTLRVKQKEPHRTNVKAVVPHWFGVMNSNPLEE